jgi:hypothetical protein
MQVIGLSDQEMSLVGPKVSESQIMVSGYHDSRLSQDTFLRITESLELNKTSAETPLKKYSGTLIISYDKFSDDSQSMIQQEFEVEIILSEPANPDEVL